MIPQSTFHILHRPLGGYVYGTIISAPCGEAVTANYVHWSLLTRCTYVSGKTV